MNTQPELHVTTEIYRGRFPHFQRPQIVGYIQIENLKFANQLKEGEVKLDLNLHYDKAIHKPDDLDVKLTDLLRFLLENEKRLNYIPENCLEKAKFYCYRGLMTCIACTPYENQEPWKIVAILFKGNIYLCARETEYKKLRRRNMSTRDKLCSSWGYKFEQYILSDNPNTKPNPNMPVDENEEFSLVFKTNLNSHTVVYRAEMDGVRCDKGTVSEPPNKEHGAQSTIDYLSTKEFIELKTNRHLQNHNQEKSFRRFKTKKWWCQSFLVGIDSILCGFRNDDGFVEQLKLFRVQDLAKMSQKFWDPNVCFNFLDNFLIYVKRCLARKIKKNHGDQSLKNLLALPMLTMLFEWGPGMPVTVDENYSYEDDPILPNWFTENYCKNFSLTC